jgi:hypothetical protein
LINRWLEAKETSYKVGMEQIETDKQVEENMKLGKASSAVIGIKNMGQRFNALLTIQIPLKQKERSTRGLGPSYSLGNKYGGEYEECSDCCCCDTDDPMPDVMMSSLSVKKTNKIAKNKFFPKQRRFLECC